MVYDDVCHAREIASYCAPNPQNINLDDLPIGCCHFGHYFVYSMLVSKFYRTYHDIPSWVAAPLSQLAVYSTRGTLRESFTIKLYLLGRPTRRIFNTWSSLTHALMHFIMFTWICLRSHSCTYTCIYTHIDLHTFCGRTNVHEDRHAHVYIYIGTTWCDYV